MDKKNNTSSCGFSNNKKSLVPPVTREEKSREQEKLKVGQIKLYRCGIVTSVEYVLNL